MSLRRALHTDQGRWALLAYVAFVLVGGLLIGLLRGHREIYPIFSWSLFSHVPPQETRDFALMVTSAAGTRLQPPRDLTASPALSDSERITAYHRLQSWGRNRPPGPPPRLVEEWLCRGWAPPVGAELVLRRFDVLRRWRTGEHFYAPIASLQLHCDPDSPTDRGDHR